MATRSTGLATVPSGQTPRLGVPRLNAEIILNVVAPFVIYQILASQGASLFMALGVAGVFPVFGVLRTWMTTRRLGGMGIVTLVTMAVGLGISLAFGDPRLLLVKESVINGVVGLAFLSSLRFKRPLTFYMVRYFASQSDAKMTQHFDERWQNRQFRQRLRLLSVVWGCGLLAEALVRVALVLVLPVASILVITPVLEMATIGGLIAFSVRSGRRPLRSAA